MFTRSSWPPVLRDQIVRREDQLSVPRRTHNNEPAIGRPRYTCQRTKISSIAIYQSKSPQSTAEIRQGHKENTHCSANASMTRRQPSSEIAATYLTSGEKTKSTKKSNTFLSLICQLRPTDDTPLRHFPVAHWIFGGLVPVASPTSP